MLSLGNREEKKVDFKAVKKRFRNEWVAFEFTSGKEGKLLAHGKDRHELHKKLRKRKGKLKAYITYTGTLLPKDVAIILTQVVNISGLPCKR